MNERELEERVARLERMLRRLYDTPGLKIFTDLNQLGQNTSVNGDLSATGDLSITGNMAVGDITADSITATTGDFTSLGIGLIPTLTEGVASSLAINTNTAIVGEIEATSLDINGNGDVSGTLTTGAVTATGAVTGGSLDINGIGDVSDALSVGSLSSSGAIAGTSLTGTSLDINGSGDISGDLALHGDISDSIASGIKVYRSTNQSLTAASWNFLSYDTEVSDTDGGWSSGTPTRLYAQRDGYYMVGANVAIGTGTTTAFGIGLRISEGTTQVRAGSFITTGMNAVYYLNVCTGMVYVTAGTYFTVEAYNGDSAAHNAYAATAAHHDFNSAFIARIA